MAVCLFLALYVEDVAVAVMPAVATSRELARRSVPGVERM